MGRKKKGRVGKHHRRHGIKRNPHAKVLTSKLFCARVLPNKKKEIKPEVDDERLH